MKCKKSKKQTFMRTPRYQCCSITLFVLAIASSVAGCTGDASVADDTEVDVVSAALTSDKSKNEIKEEVIRNSRTPSPPEQASDKARVSPGLQSLLAAATPEQEFDVDIFLRMPPESNIFEKASASGVIQEGKNEEMRLNGRPATEDDFVQLSNEQLERLASLAQRRREQAAELAAELERRTGMAGSSSNSPSFRANVPAAGIQKLVEENSDLIDAVSEAFQPEQGDGLLSALVAIGVSGTGGAWDLGLDGDTVGVWMNDGDGRPDTTNPAIDTTDFTAQDYGSEPIEDHATRTTASVMQTAPEAHVHFAVPTQSCNLRNDVDTFSNPPVYISSLSNDSGTTTSYTDCSRDWDNFVYNTRIAPFILAHNDASNVRHNAKAYNVITVGGYDDNTGNMYAASNFGNPETGAEKPEIVAPAVDIDVAGWTGLNGTSLATPIAAGTTACLMEDDTYLRYQPQLIKAKLMAIAVNIEGGVPISDLDGAGRVDFLRAHYNGRWAWWTGDNDDWFTEDTDGDGRLEITFSEDGLVSGETYRVVIAWLVEGNYVRTNLEPNMDIDLWVESPGGYAWTSMSVDNAFEVVEFVAPESGTYDVVIERWWNSGTGDVALGYYLNWD